MSDLLQRTAAELIAHPPHPAPEVRELRRRINRRRGRRSAAAGIVTVTLIVVGLVALQGRASDNAVADQLDQLGFDNDGTIPCADFGCGQFDPIAVEPGVNDFYVGPPSLGDPLISRQFWDAALRCKQLDAAGTTCTQVEGLGFVPLVTYGAAGPNQIQVGTSFGVAMSIENYALSVAGDLIPDPSKQTATTVRGHAAISFTVEPSSPALLWEERPGVIVWIAVPVARQRELATLAAGIELSPGPSSMPGQLVIPNTGRPWATVGNTVNGAAGLVAARFQGAECIGWGYIDECKDGIKDRTFVVLLDESTAFTGAVPPNVDRVRVTPLFGEPVVVTPFSYAGFASRFYQISLPQDYAKTVEWLGSDGAVLATYDVDTDALGGFGGWPVARVRLDGRAFQLSADYDSAGTSPDPSIGVGKHVSGTEAVLCVYLTPFGPSAVACSSPEQLNVSDTFAGVAFGAAGSDVASVLVDGEPVELRASPEIPDRRFFVEPGSQVTFLDRAGKKITVPPPIDRQPQP